MKRGIFFFPAAVTLFVIICLLSIAVTEVAARDYETELNFGVGYREDDLDWNIAGDTSGQNPNILSELTWSNLEIIQIRAGFKSSIRRAYVRGYANYGWIEDGKNQDSDYLGDNRTLEFSRSNNSSDDGTVADGSIGIGYKIIDRKVVIAPVVGYSVHTQRLTITNGFQTIPPTGPFPNLDSSYKTKWKGPWVGMDFSLNASDKFSVFANVEYHWADYDAKANWNLRTDFAHPVSFRHWADGEGIVLSAGGVYSSRNERLRLRLSVEYQDWQTDPGIDRTFFANGAVADTRLNEVNWRSLAVMFETVYHFH